MEPPPSIRAKSDETNQSSLLQYAQDSSAIGLALLRKFMIVCMVFGAVDIAFQGSLWTIISVAGKFSREGMWYIFINSTLTIVWSIPLFLGGLEFLREPFGGRRKLLIYAYGKLFTVACSLAYSIWVYFALYAKSYPRNYIYSVAQQATYLAAHSAIVPILLITFLSSVTVRQISQA